jgi:hypothetical protein
MHTKVAAISQISGTASLEKRWDLVATLNGRLLPQPSASLLAIRMLRRLCSTFRHAFAIESAGPAEPSPEERAALEPLIAEVRRRGLAGPAVLFLEGVSPLNNVGAQALHFMQPFATAVLDPVKYATLARFLEKRGSVAWMVAELQREG